MRRDLRFIWFSAYPVPVLVAKDARPHSQSGEQGRIILSFPPAEANRKVHPTLIPYGSSKAFMMRSLAGCRRIRVHLNILVQRGGAGLIGTRPYVGHPGRGASPPC